jgi:hypothetical protein
MHNENLSLTPCIILRTWRLLFVHLSHLNFPAWKLPSQIKTLRVWDFFQLKHFQKAYCMMICPFNTFLTSFPECPSSFKHLTELNLSHCSHIKCFPGVGPFLPKLRMMNVYNCKKLKSLSNEMRKLTSLQELTICSCIALESFPNGDLPPNLISLEIWDCDNLDGHLSKWNLQSLAFLRDFSIAGGCWHCNLSRWGVSASYNSYFRLDWKTSKFGISIHAAPKSCISRRARNCWLS